MTSSTFKYINGKIFDPSGQTQIGVQSPTLGDVIWPMIIAQSAVPVNLTGTVAEVVLASIVIPGGMMGPNGRLRITSRYSMPGTANSKAFFVRWASGGPVLSGVTIVTPSTVVYSHVMDVANRGNQASQNSQNWSMGANTGAYVSTTANTAVDQTITLSAQLASAGETITLESYMIEVLPGA